MSHINFFMKLLGQRSAGKPHAALDVAGAGDVLSGNAPVFDPTLGGWRLETVAAYPMSHPFIERLIGTVRREFLDHVPFWGIVDLERKLDHFKEYYNTNRTHRALDGTPPAAISKNPNSSIVRLDNFRWDTCCRGLYQLPAAA